jgi:hypothetical protein
LVRNKFNGPTSAAADRKQLNSAESLLECLALCVVSRQFAGARGPASLFLASQTESTVWRQSLEFATLGSEFDDDYAAAKEFSHIFGGFSTLEESALARIIHGEDVA